MENASSYLVIRKDTPARLRKVKFLLASLDIEITERCNNNCIHCMINLPIDDSDAKEKELSTSKIKTILEEATALGCLRVRFTGGEPLVRKDFEELYIFTRRLGIKVLLFTNATLISSRLVKLFQDIPPLEKIEITVYGMKKSSYEKVTRNPGSFEAAWRGINLLLENEIPFVVKSTLLPPNKDEISQFEAWSSSIPWMDHPPACSVFLDLRCRRDSEQKNLQIKKLRLPPSEAVKILSRRQEVYRKNIKEFCAKFLGAPTQKLFTCSAGVRSGCVDAYGYFQPCLLMKHPDLAYDLKKGSLRDAITDFCLELRKIKAENPQYIKQCSRCFLKGLCEQCPAKSWIEHGNLDTPIEYQCEIAHAQARQIGLLKDGEKAWNVKDWRKRINEIPE